MTDQRKITLARVFMIGSSTLAAMLGVALILSSFRPAAAQAPPAGSSPAISVVLAPVDAGAVPDDAPRMSVSPSIEQATQSFDDQWRIVEDYGPVWGGMLILFAIGTAIVKRNDEHHWLAQGNMLTGLVGSIGILGSLVEAHFSTASSAGIPVTLLLALKLLLQKPRPKA
jgi:hypothetical protein